MPRQTRETELPKPPATPLDWANIASSGKVWDFIEGEDFTGKAGSYRARLKTAARKAGVDFDSQEVHKNGTTILKIKAFLRAEPTRPPVKQKSDVIKGQLDFASLAIGGESGR